jgi:superfamily I DNA/RNA helicase
MRRQSFSLPNMISMRLRRLSVLEGVSVDDLDEGTDTLRGYVSLLHGPAPQLVSCQSETEELDELVDWVRGRPTEEIMLADIGILCSRRADVERVQNILRSADIDTVVLKAGTADDRTVPGVRITTMHRAKGLEFYAIAIPFLSQTAFPPAGALMAAVDAADKADIIDQHKSLLHVAATRAKRALRISWSGQPTSLIK